MKNYGFLALAAAGMLFGACSSDESVESTVQQNLNEEVVGYFAAGIHLPSTPVTSTRAWAEKDNLDDGLSEEYKVNSTLLLIFAGADEASAKLKQVVPITDPTTEVSYDPNHITVNNTYVVELTAKKENVTDNYYALAVCNGVGIIEKGATDNIAVVNGTEVTDATISDLQALITTSDGENPFINGQGFFMTNAVLSKVQGGDADPTAAPELQILAPIDADKIYETEEDAAKDENDPATDIYVERAVAKATINGGSVKAAENLVNKAGVTTTVALAGWCLDNTNQSSYIVRKVGEDWTWNLASKSASVTTDKYRFVGGNAVDKHYGTETLYRTYWALDPNYDQDWATGMFYEPTEKTWDDGSNPLYCFENTFDVAHQQYQQTTRAIVKLTLNGGKTFYTIANDKKTLWAADEVTKQAAATFLANNEVKTWFKANGKAGETLSAEDLTFKFNDDEKAGIVKIESVTIPGSKLTAGADVEADADNADLAKAVTSMNNSLNPIRRYVNGETFYSIRIKHFGDDLTPWNSDEYMEGYKPAESTIATIYPDATDSRQDANYLGRYGMVRNNWYDLVLGTVLKVGSAVPPSLNTSDSPDPDPDDPDPEDPEHPDDDVESYIKTRINVLSWAKRVQNWNLK